MGSMKVFRDPIHGLVTFRLPEERVLLDLLDAPEFQRLRRISQLGLSSQTYPTSTHTRLSHLLGVSHLAGRIFDQVCPAKPGQTVKVIDKNGEHTAQIQDLRLVIRIAALLHDVGHGPFSHAFEHVFEFDHEEMTRKLLQTTSLRAILANASNRTVRDHGLQWATELIAKTLRPHWATEIISSQLDADRLDYLLRDGYMCGVSYARFDLDWLIQHMRVDQVRVGHDLLDVIVLNGPKTMSSLEDFFMSRYHMYEHVYYHKTTRGFEGLLQKIFERVRELMAAAEPPTFLDDVLERFIQDPSVPELFVELDEPLVTAQIHAWRRHATDPTLRVLCTHYGHRHPFKMVTESPTPEETLRLQEEFQRSGLDMRHHFFVDRTENVAYKDPYLLAKGPSQHVWLARHEGFQELADASPVIKTLRNRVDRRDRIYVSPDFRGRRNHA